MVFAGNEKSTNGKNSFKKNKKTCHCGVRIHFILKKITMTADLLGCAASYSLKSQYADTKVHKDRLS